MIKKNTYKPRYFISNTIRAKINIYKNGYLRRFYERRSRRVKRGGLFRHYVLVAKNRKWTMARRFMAPRRRFKSGKVRTAGTTIYGRPSKRLYINAFRRKQALRHFYGLGFAGKEKRITSLFKNTNNLQGISNENFFSRLESRLDRTLFRRRIFPTLYGCRQFIQHYGVHLNNLYAHHSLVDSIKLNSLSNQTNEFKSVNTRLEYSTQYEVQIGDTISVPEQIWSVLYYTLLERPYYRRWGSFLKVRRFISQFKKKVFRARSIRIRRTRPSYRKVGFSRTTRFNSFADVYSNSKNNEKNTLKNTAHSASQLYKGNKGSKTIGQTGFTDATFITSPAKAKGWERVTKTNLYSQPNLPNKNRQNIRNGLRKRSWYANTSAPKNSLLDFYAKRLRWLVMKPKRLNIKQITFWQKFKYTKGRLAYSRSPRYIWKCYRQVSRLRQLNQKITSVNENVGVQSKHIQKSFYTFAGHNKHRRSHFLLSTFSAFSKIFPIREIVELTADAAYGNSNLITSALLEPNTNKPESRRRANKNISSFEKQITLPVQSLQANAKIFRMLKDWKHSRKFNLIPFCNELTPETSSTINESSAKQFLFKELARVLQQIKTTPEARNLFIKETGITQKRRDFIVATKVANIKNNKNVIAPTGTKKNVAFIQDLRNVLRSLPWREKNLAVRKQRKFFTFLHAQNLRKTFLPIYTASKINTSLNDKKGVKPKIAFTNQDETTAVTKGEVKLKIETSTNSKQRPSSRNRYNIKKTYKQSPDFIKRTRRRLARFIRRWRRRVRRIRRFPRIKSVHRHFPSYLQRDLRTLRCTKISAATSSQIYAPYRRSPQKIFAFYRSRGYL